MINFLASPLFPVPKVRNLASLLGAIVDEERAEAG